VHRLPSYRQDHRHGRAVYRASCDCSAGSGETEDEAMSRYRVAYAQALEAYHDLIDRLATRS
jgi:hypothetical protein